MLDYDYLARPVQLVPRTLEAMPTVQDNGGTYVFRLKKGIFFTPDPAFKGKPRELTAADQAYGIKRLLDPKVKSPWRWLVDGKIVGAQRGVGEGHQDRALRLRGADRRPRGRRPLHAEDSPRATRSAVSLRARGAEYGGRGARGRRGVRHRLRRPSGRDRSRTCSASTSAARRSFSSPIRAIGKRRTCPRAPCRRNRCRSRRRSRARGSRSPGASRRYVLEEGQAQWLAFLNREVELLERVPSAFVEEALVDGKLRPALAAKGIRHVMLLRPNTGGSTSTWTIPSSAATRR